jgi:hypothetical protein
MVPPTFGGRRAASRSSLVRPSRTGGWSRRDKDVHTGGEAAYSELVASDARHPAPPYRGGGEVMCRPVDDVDHVHRPLSGLVRRLPPPRGEGWPLPRPVTIKVGGLSWPRRIRRTGSSVFQERSCPPRSGGFHQGGWTGSRPRCIRQTGSSASSKSVPPHDPVSRLGWFHEVFSDVVPPPPFGRWTVG